MEQTYYLIIVGALVGEYLLSSVSSVLNMNSITESVPDGFQNHYDEEKYAKSQMYLKTNTQFGLFTGTFSLIVMLIVIHTGVFGFLDEFVRTKTSHPILSGLLFFGIIFLINDLIYLPFSIYWTFVI